MSLGPDFLFASIDADRLVDGDVIPGRIESLALDLEVAVT